MTHSSASARDRAGRELSDPNHGARRGSTIGISIAIVALAVVVLFVFAGFQRSEEGVPAAEDLIAPPVPPLPKGLSFYVAPNGEPGNDGSLERPVDLATALSERSPAGPGDTIYLRGGTYKGPFESALRGTENDPIVVRQYPGERAILDGAPGSKPVVTVGGTWTWFWGFELTHSGPARRSAQTGRHPTDLERGVAVVCHGQQIKFINLIVHDLSGGFEIDKEAVGTELYGNIIFHNGWLAKEVTEGDGIRVHAGAGDTIIRDNAVFKQFGEGIAVYASSQNKIYLEGNVVFNNGAFTESFTRNLVISGGQFVLKDHSTYFGGNARSGENNFGLNAGCAGFSGTGNYFAHLESYPVTLAKCGGRFEKNTLAGTVDPAIVSRHPNNTFLRKERPQQLEIRVRPNLYDPSRALVVVFNWPRRTTLELDISAAKFKNGAAYEVWNVQDLFGTPIASGSYTGGNISIPLSTSTVAKPVGNVPKDPTPTPREFGVFQVLDVSRSATSPTTPPKSTP